VAGQVGEQLEDLAPVGAHHPALQLDGAEQAELDLHLGLLEARPEGVVGRFRGCRLGPRRGGGQHPDHPLIVGAGQLLCVQVGPVGRDEAFPRHPQGPGTREGPGDHGHHPGPAGQAGEAVQVASDLAGADQHDARGPAWLLVDESGGAGGAWSRGGQRLDLPCHLLHLLQHLLQVACGPDLVHRRQSRGHADQDHLPALAPGRRGELRRHGPQGGHHLLVGPLDGDRAARFQVGEDELPGRLLVEAPDGDKGGYGRGGRARVGQRAGIGSGEVPGDPCRLEGWGGRRRTVGAHGEAPGCQPHLEDRRCCRCPAGLAEAGSQLPQPEVHPSGASEVRARRHPTDRVGVLAGGQADPAARGTGPQLVATTAHELGRDPRGQQTEAQARAQFHLRPRSPGVGLEVGSSAGRRPDGRGRRGGGPGRRGRDGLGTTTRIAPGAGGLRREGGSSRTQPGYRRLGSVNRTPPPMSRSRLSDQMARQCLAMDARGVPGRRWEAAMSQRLSPRRTT
jgi:hypothetical protein